MKTIKADLRQRVDYFLQLDAGRDYPMFAYQYTGQMDTEYIFTIGEIVKTVSGGELAINNDMISIPVLATDLELGDNLATLESQSKIAGIALKVHFNFKTYE